MSLCSVVLHTTPPLTYILIRPSRSSHGSQEAHSQAHLYPSPTCRLLSTWSALRPWPGANLVSKCRLLRHQQRPAPVAALLRNIHLPPPSLPMLPAKPCSWSVGGGLHPPSYNTVVTSSSLPTAHCEQGTPALHQSNPCSTPATPCVFTVSLRCVLHVAAVGCLALWLFAVVAPASSLQFVLPMLPSSRRS